jgi:uncharacterized delta-60 repeat protein
MAFPRKRSRGALRCAPVVLLLAASAFGADTVWVRRYQGQSSEMFNQAADMAVDADGNVYVCGSGEKTYPGNTDMLLVKYSPAGEMLWADAIGGDVFSPSDMAQALAIDSAGNVYVAGVTENADSCYDDMTIAKYDRDGNRLWDGCRKTRWRYDDLALDIALGRSGDVYVCGADGRDSLGVGNSAFCVMRLNPADGSTVWSRSYVLSVHAGPPPRRLKHPGFLADWDSWPNCATALAVTPDGGIVATGFGADDSGNYEMWTMKFDTAGNRRWEKLIHAAAGPWDDAAFDLVVSRLGNLYLAGFGERSESSEDFAVVELDSSGLLAGGWLMDGPGQDYATGIALDDSVPQNVYTVGTCEHPELSFQMMAQKLSADLEPRWGDYGAQFGTAEQDEWGYDIAADHGRVYVTGVDSLRMAVLCYSSRNVLGGETLWTRWFDHPGGVDELGACLCVEDSDHIYVAGQRNYYHPMAAAMLTARFCTASGVSEAGQHGGVARLSVQPNPASRSCLLAGPATGTGRLAVELYDVAGRPAREFSAAVNPNLAAAVRLDLTGLSAGVYLLKVSSGPAEPTRTLKLVVR